MLTLIVSPKPRPSELLRLLAHRPRTAVAIVKMGVTALGPSERAFRRGDDDAAMLAFLRGVLGREHLKRLSETRRQQARENLSELKATLVGPGLPQISEDDVRGVSTRTLLLTGEHSPMFSLCLTDRVEELLPRATRVEIPDASHFAHEDNPRDVNEAILTFLARAASEDAPG